METLLYYRQATFDRKAIDVKARRVTLAFSSEEPVERDGYSEILGHRQGEYDFSRLNNSAPLLLNHDPHDQIGVVESARVENDGSGRRVGRATVRFGKGQLADEVFQDVQDGIRRHVSVGYAQGETVSREQGSDGTHCVRFKWMPYELTLASIPADTSVGIGRAKVTNEKRNFMNDNKDRTEIIELEKHMLHDHPHLADDIRQLKTRAFCGELTYDQFRKEVLAVAQAKTKQNRRIQVVPGETGMTGADIGQYSLRRAILNASENGGRLRNCFEADLSQQAEENSKTRASGFFVPMEVVIGAPLRNYKRDMTVGTFNSGGAFVPTDVMSIIELLRNRLVCVRMGATVLAGLSGNVAFPRETAASTAYSLPEIGNVLDSNPNVDQVPLLPHRVSATVKYSKQLLIQSSIDAEGFVRDDLVKQIAIKQDALALTGGGGADEPTGILNTPGVGSMNFGGAPTWATIVNFETNLGLANADQGRLGWAVAPLVRGVWKQTAKLLTGASTVAAVPLWQDTAMPSQEAVDGMVNSYRATSSNQLSGANLVVFGNWTELLLGMFGGLDIIIDPYTLATNAEVRCTVNSFFDVALRHAQSFCVSSDSGAQ